MWRPPCNNAPGRLPFGTLRRRQGGRNSVSLGAVPPQVPPPPIAQNTCFQRVARISAQIPDSAGLKGKSIHFKELSCSFGTCPVEGRDGDKKNPFTYLCAILGKNKGREKDGGHAAA